MARAIKLMAQLLQQHLRSADTLARLSVHQLAMLLPDLKAEKAFETVLQRIQESLQAPALLRGNLSLYSVHLGWSSYPQHGITAAEMMEHAQANLMMHTGLQNRPLSL